MADALADRGREVTLADGRRSPEIVTAVYASARERRPVALPLAAENPFCDHWPPGQNARSRISRE